MLQIVSPWSATAVSTMYGAHAGISTSATRATSTCTSGDVGGERGDGGGQAGAAAAGRRRRRLRPASSGWRTSSLRRAISVVGSSCSSPSCSIASTAASSASRHSSRMSITRRSRPPVRPRSVSKTSSIVCVSAAMRAKPIVPLMPLRECAMRKISSIVSLSDGRLLDPDDGEVQRLQVLAALGEEHSDVLRGVHQTFR